MIKEFPVVFTGESFTAYVDGKTHTIRKGHDNFNLVVQAFRDKDYEKIQGYLQIQNAVKGYVGGNVEVKGDEIFYRGERVENSVVSRIRDFMREGLPFEPMVNFLDNLMDNPSYNSRKQLYTFLEHKNLPITPDGCFLSYKAVQSDYKSKTKGVEKVTVTSSDGNVKVEVGYIDNSVGNIIEMERRDVNDNPDQHCSTGIHCGAIGYVSSFKSGNDRVVVVKTNPKDVVSVPNDEICRKVRTSRYEVIAEYEGELEDTFNEGTDIYKEHTNLESIFDFMNDDDDDGYWDDVDED